MVILLCGFKVPEVAIKAAIDWQVIGCLVAKICEQSGSIV
jgi:hypothetical protein